MTAEPKLSARALRLLERVRAGRWYPVHGSKVPKAMDELVAAGLVGTAGRAAVLVACYVPKGYRVRAEVYPPIPTWRADR